MPVAPSLRDQFDPDAVAALADEAELSAEAGVLGKLVFYAIGDTIRVARDELETLFGHHDLEERFLPKAINPGAVAAGLLRGLHEEIELGGRSYELDFHLETKLDGAIEAPLVRTRRRTQRERAALAIAEGTGDWQQVNEWDVETVGTAVWDPAFPDELPTEIDPLHGPEYPYEQLIETLAEEFEDRRRFYGGAAVSAMVGKILNETMSIRTRPTGGVWLVPAAAMDLLERVENLVRLLDAEYRRPPAEGKSPAPTEFDSIVLVDREKNRLYVRDKVEGQVLGELSTAVEQLLALAAANLRPRPAELASAAALRARALTYRDSFALVITGGSERIADALADFDRAYAAALAAGSAPTGATAAPGVPVGGAA
jgi:hypothetical protein